MITEAILAIARGEQVWMTHVPEGHSHEHLTEREREVLRLLAEGLSNQEIASRLNVTVATVRNVLTLIYHKLGVKSARSAIAWVWRRRLVQGVE